jgi:hypothetical protein
VGQIELHQRLFGDGLVGTVDTGLSWSQQRALESISSASTQMATQISNVAAEISGVRSSLMALGWDIAGSVHSLEYSLSIRLDRQAALLSDAVSVLDAINVTLRTPAKTQAAEHIANAGALLGQGRAKRALALAEQAIQLDPINPHGFLAAAWAQAALHQFAEAREGFEEAAEASTGNLRCAATRQAARLAYADGESARALSLVRSVQSDAEDDDERHALAYDGSIYEAAAGDPTAAAEQLHAVCMADERYAAMAAVDRALADFPVLVNALERALQDWADVRVDLARSAVARASELEALARTTRDEVFPERGWMQFGISGARFLRLREGLLTELDELVASLTDLQARELRSAAALEAGVASVSEAEERLAACRERVLEANREFAAAESRS